MTLICLKFYLFADDTAIFSSHKSNIDSNQIINAELENVTDWLTANKLSLNISKSNFLNFTLHKQTSNNITLNNTTLVTKYLGVLIDDKLKWKEHIHHVNLKLSKGIGLLFVAAPSEQC